MVEVRKIQSGTLHNLPYSFRSKYDNWCKCISVIIFRVQNLFTLKTKKQGKLVTEVLHFLNNNVRPKDTIIVNCDINFTNK